MKKSKLLVSCAVAGLILGSQAALADHHEEEAKEGKAGCKGKAECKGEKKAAEGKASCKGKGGCGGNGACSDEKKEEKKK